jgi:uncharacterized protein (DUF4213/DUF364 family)
MSSLLFHKDSFAETPIHLHAFKIYTSYSIFFCGKIPDPACEYLLPSQDFVFCTGVTLINKTAPRIFDLARNATLIVMRFCSSKDHRGQRVVH